MAADVRAAQRALRGLQQRFEEALVAVRVPAVGCRWAYEVLEADWTAEVGLEGWVCGREDLGLDCLEHLLACLGSFGASLKRL